MLNIFGGQKAGLTVQDAISGLAAGTVTVLDVRESGEVQASGTAKGGLHIPLGILPLKADPKAPDHNKHLSTDKPVAVFCAVGGRAGNAVQFLRKLGYDAHNIGGFGDWVSAGGPVKR